MKTAAWMITVAVLLAAACPQSNAQAGSSEDTWAVPRSTNLLPHFEKVNGHEQLFVDGAPFAMLATEIPWWDLRAGSYRQDEGVYDSLYPAAVRLGLNTLKVPVKWSMIEPEKDQYDFSYVDHALSQAKQNHLHLVLDWFGHYASGAGTIYQNLSGQMFAPMYIVQDETTYPRAVDGDGVAHHDAVSYDSDAVINREVKAFKAFMLHLKQVDPDHIVIGIQLENEIAVFGSDRHNPKLFRDHSAASNRFFQQGGFTNDLKYSAWSLSSRWIRPLTEVAHATYPIPIFHNFVNGSLEPNQVGGSPGEDVATYLQNVPDLSFVAVNAYFCGAWKDTTCPVPSDGKTEDFRAALQHFQVGRNIAAVTETNSGDTFVAPRFAFIAVGEFATPIFSPWCLTVSYPESYQPYLLANGKLANGAPAFHEALQALSLALPPIMTYAGTDNLRVFQAPAIGQSYSTEERIGGLTLDMSEERDGQAIAIHPTEKQLLIVGYRTQVSIKNEDLVWPTMQKLQVAKVRWSDSGWVKVGAADYGVDQSNKSLYVDLADPQAVLISLP
jgi:hypothetical protein